MPTGRTILTRDGPALAATAGWGVADLETVRELLVYGPQGAVDRLLAENGIRPEQVVSVEILGEDSNWLRHRVVYRVQNTA